MGKFQKALLTDAGRVLLMQAQLGDGGITFTRGVSGAGVYTGDENIAQMTALKDQKQSFAIDKVRVASDTSVCVRYIIANHTAQGDLQTGYDVTEIGLYAKIGDGDEILYCIAVAEITDYLPPYNELMATSITVEMYCDAGSAEDVTIVAAEGIYATSEDVNAIEDRLELLEYMTYYNDYLSPIDTEDGILITDDGNAILANWKYKEA